MSKVLYSKKTTLFPRLDQSFETTALQMLREVVAEMAEKDPDRRITMNLSIKTFPDKPIAEVFIEIADPFVMRWWHYLWFVLGMVIFIWVFYYR
jgi:hypothetical protein